MGKTNRHEKTEDRRSIRNLKGRNAKRKPRGSKADRGEGKAKLENLVSFTSQRHISNDEPNELNKLTIKTMEETDARIGLECVCGKPMKECVGFDTLEEMPEESNKQDDTG